MLGAEHLDTLRTHRQLADHTGVTGDPVTALDMLTELLAVQESVLGTEHHPDTLMTRRDLADWTGETGNATGAVDALTALIPVHERVLGSEHPSTLRAPP